MNPKPTVDKLFEQALKNGNNKLLFACIPRKELNVVAATYKALNAKNKEAAAVLIPLALMYDEFDLKTTIFKMLRANNKEAVEVLIDTTCAYVSDTIIEARKLGQKDMVNMLTKYVGM